MGFQKIRKPLLVDRVDDGKSVLFSEKGSGVSIQDESVSVRRAKLTLDGFVVSIDESDDFGGTKLLDLPDRNIYLLGLEADLSLVKGGVTNGLEAAVDVNVSIGSAVATAIDLTTTAAENDMVESTALTDDSLTVLLQAHSHGQSGDGLMPRQILDGAASALYLNASVTAGITASDALTVSGSLLLYYVDLGNETS